MLQYPKFDPIAIRLGPIKIYWYGLMYVLGFLLAWLLGVLRANKPNSGWDKEQVSDVIFFAALGVIIGGRLGYVIFYGMEQFLREPLYVFKIWQGGMAFHGGLIGVMLALWLYGRHIGKSFLQISDFVVPLAPLGLAAGRMGNFINGEIWGRVSNVPWAMVFPNAGDMPRHPSQLYEFFFEGILLFTIIWLYSAKPRATGRVSAMFLLCYGCFRFILEFYRQPDWEMGIIAFNWMTMGHLLSVPMIVLGLFLFWWSRHATVS